MLDGLSWLGLVAFLGAAQALLIGAVLLSMRSARFRALGVLLLVLGLAMGVITLSHAGPGGEPHRLQRIETGLSLLASPIFFLWLSAVMDGRHSWRPGELVHLAVPGGWISAVILAPLLGRPELAGLPPISAVVAYQVFYTLWGGWRSVSRAAPEAIAAEVQLARVAVGLFLLIHLAQLVRFASDRPLLRDVVPITAAAALFALTAAAVRQSHLLRRVADRRRRYRGSSLSDEQAERSLVLLERCMQKERRFLDPELTLQRLAGDIGLPRSHLSQLINQRCGMSFNEYLAGFRVREAERLLRDPALAHLTVEAIGERAGFRSRSPFYEAFRRATGRTPAAFRAAAETSAPPSG